MKSLNWNDLNDDSDIDHVSSDEEQLKKQPEKNKNIEPPSLQKTVSSPEQLYKSQKTDNNSRIAQNIEKLSKHNDSKVWLYLAEFSNRQAEVNQILNSIQQFQKINSLSKGWNILVRTQAAAKYIEKGHFQRGVLLKFVYSNRNENKNQHKYQRKLQKKYSEKYQEVKGSKDKEQTQTPKIKSRQTYNQKSNYQKDKQYSEGGEKKKVKYVAKAELPKKIQQQVEPPGSPEQAKSKLNNQTKQNQIKNVILDKVQPTQDQKKTENVEQTENKVKNGSIKNERQEQQEKQEKAQNQDKKSQSQQSIPKQKTKKPKKKNKSKGSFVDHNNPFSALV